MNAPLPAPSAQPSGGSLPTDFGGLLLRIGGMLITLLLAGSVPTAVGYLSSLSELRDALLIGGFIKATLPMTGAFVLTTILVIGIVQGNDNHKVFSSISAAATGVAGAGLASFLTGWGGLTGAEYASISHVQNVGVLTPLIYVVKAYGLYIQKYQGQTFVVAVGVGIVSGLWLRRQWFKLLGAVHPQATSPAPVATTKSTARSS